MDVFDYIEKELDRIEVGYTSYDGTKITLTMDEVRELVQNLKKKYKPDGDVIYRQAAIDALKHDEEYDEDIPNRADGVRDAIITISSLPSVQPEHALKDCRNCKHGQYNDHWDTYFCYNSGNCEDWNLWESDIIPSAQSERKMCNLCKYYEGVHRVQGHAPCSFWKIGGVLYDDYCSRWEKFDE